MKLTLAVAALILLAGCTSSAPPEDAAVADTATVPATSEPAPDPAQTPSPPAETSLATPLPAQVDAGALAQAVERLTSTPLRFAVTNGFEGEDITSTDGIASTGEFDGQWSASQTFAVENGERSQITMEAITDTNTGFMYTPGFPQPTGNPLAQAAQGWIRVDLERVEQELGLEFSVGVTAFEAFGSLRSMVTSDTEVVEGQASTARGVPTRSFSFGFTPQEQSASEVLGAADAFVVLQIDADGWIRQVDISSGPFIQRVEFYDLGSAIVVEIPADANDITEDIISQAG